MLMNHTATLLTIVLGGALVSAAGLIAVPEWQLAAELEPIVDEASQTSYPAPPVRDELAFGRADYRGLGCVTCHTQQTRRPGFGSDHARGWGERQTVARDLLFDELPVVGWQRLGPDLANIGARQPDAAWHLLHLYDPRAINADSSMPSYRFLFERRELGAGEPPPLEALILPDGHPDASHAVAIVPTRRAHNLVAYLLSLDRSHPLAEAPFAPAAPLE